MPRFFVQRTAITEGTVTVTGEDAHHISRALRMAAGEHITVCDAEGIDYDCVLNGFLPDRVTATVVGSSPSHGEPPYRAVLYQGLPKGDKLDTVIQKAVECGVFCVVPFESERCIVRIREGESEGKLARRNRIAEEAAKQCGRGILPRVRAAIPFRTMLEEARKADLALFCYEGEGTVPLPRVLTGRPTGSDCPTVAIVVGSEGGFSPAEAKAAADAGLIPVSLGTRILRTETAPLFALAALSCFYEIGR